MLMTELMHRLPDTDPFASGVQRARQRSLVTSAAVRTTIAENYVGWPIG
jgi:p-hydroxybenzoate 3-monooxygenase